ncbi:hypothetical protein ACKWTF_011357 [Chironomus riparius]
MSFEIIGDKANPLSSLQVKRLDGKWKNFPASILRPLHAEKLNSFVNFPVRSDDIFIFGYPRSGTSRLMELVWIIANDCDFETLLEYDADVRTVSFEIPEWSFEWRDKFLAKSFEEMKSPRSIKCHLPVQLLPDEFWTKKPKSFYISRDPKDVAVSQYHFANSFSTNSGKLEDFLDDFMADKIVHDPYRENMWNYMNLPNNENICYFTYEEMSDDLGGAIKKVADFLGKTVSDENAEKIKDYLKFENMKTRRTNDNKFTHQVYLDKANLNLKSNLNFIRKGVVGGHKTEMSQEYADKIDKWFAESKNLNQGYNFKEQDGGIKSD